MLAGHTRSSAIADVLESVATVARRMTATRSTPFGATRLTRSQVDALFLLAHNRGQVTPGLLAASLGLTAGAVTQLVDGLRAAGLVDRVAHPSDARRRMLQLSAGARRHVDRFERDVVDRVSPLFDDLSDDEVRALGVLLARVQRPG